MTRSDLVRRLERDFPFLKKAQIDQAVRAIFEKIAVAMEQDDRIELRKFGTFSVHHRRAHIGRDPRNGNAVRVPPKSVPFFKAGKHLRKRISGNMEATDRLLAEDAKPSR